MFTQNGALLTMGSTAFPLFAAGLAGLVLCASSGFEIKDPDSCLWQKFSRYSVFAIKMRTSR